MEKPRRSRSRVWSVSPAALALAVGLAGWGAAALATNNPIPGVDIIVKKDPGGIVASTPTNKDGTYQFIGLAPGKYDLSVAGQRVQAITVGANRSIRGSLTSNDDGTASVTIGDRKPVVLRGLVTATVSDSDRYGKKRTADPTQDGGDTPGKKQNTKGVVTLVRGTAPRPGEGKPDGPPGVSDANTPLAQVSTTRGRLEKPDEPFAPRMGGGKPDESPRVMDETNSAMGQVSTTRGRLEKPDQPLQPGISDQGSSGGLSSYDRAPPPDAASSGDRAARTFEVTVQPVNDPPSKVDTGPPFVPGGPVGISSYDLAPPPGDSAGNGNPPGRAELAVFLVRAMLMADAKGEPAGQVKSVSGQSAPDGAFAFAGLSPGNYVVEIVDAAGKVVGTSPSQSVAAGGRLSGRIGQSERGGGYGAFFTSTGVPIRQNASADKPARSTVAASDAAANPAGGFGQGMPGSPGFGPAIGGLNGPAPGMMSPPGLGPGAPAMSGPMGAMGGRTGPMVGGGAMGRP